MRRGSGKSKIYNVFHWYEIQAANYLIHRYKLHKIAPTTTDKVVNEDGIEIEAKFAIAIPQKYQAAFEKRCALLRRVPLQFKGDLPADFYGLYSGVAYRRYVGKNAEDVPGHFTDDDPDLFDYIDYVDVEVTDDDAIRGLAELRDYLNRITFATRKPRKFKNVREQRKWRQSAEGKRIAAQCKGREI